MFNVLAEGLNDRVAERDGGLETGVEGITERIAKSMCGNYGEEDIGVPSRVMWMLGSVVWCKTRGGRLCWMILVMADLGRHDEPLVEVNDSLGIVLFEKTDQT
jgi:hypothetical protein